MIYNTLVKEHIKGKTWEEDEAERKNQIREMIKNYKPEQLGEQTVTVL